MVNTADPEAFHQTVVKLIKKPFTPGRGNASLFAFFRGFTQ
jgi:hypothetical protein